MAKHVIKTDQPQTISINDDKSQWTVAKGVSLTGPWGIYNYMIDDVDITVAGRIEKGSLGILAEGSGQGLGPKRFSIDVEKTGLVEGITSAFQIDGDEASIENHGLIRSEFAAINMKGNDFTLTNDGKIIGSTGQALALMGGNFSIENNGLMKTGGAYAAVTIIPTGSGDFTNGVNGRVIGGMLLEGSGQDISLFNRGRITANEAAGLAVKFGAGDDLLVNKGRIEGMVEMGMGDDAVNLARGKFIGAMIMGGEGDDTYVIGKSHVYIAEYDQGGTDTIKTARSYEIATGKGNFIERLEAAGHGNINLSGAMNEDNTLIGNDGKNILTGGNGDDFIVGGKGADTINSYAGKDEFSFRQGDGSDNIRYFDQGNDKILLNLFDDIEDFGDLEGRISLSNDGEDTIIDLGFGDRIRLVDFDETLTASDFKILGDLNSP